jgi:transcriptional regulator with XRE-family HTH domain
MRIEKKGIGARIQKFRKAIDLTQAEAAEKAGIDTIYLSQIERGQKLMSIDALYRIAAVLKVSPGAILDGGEVAEDDPLLKEVRAVLAKWNVKQQKAVLKALRALSEL